MTDHRVADLSFGHLGEASYDTEEQEWHFSRSFSYEREVVQLLPFKHCVLGIINKYSETENQEPHNVTRQMRWLVKDHPEIFPGNIVASSVLRDDFNMSSDPAYFEGNLFAVGSAFDADHMSGSRAVRILALPSGKAGNVLRLIRPGVEVLGWKKGDGVRISLMDPSLSAEGFWMESSGPIRQIVPSSEDGSSNWFAIRQDAAITFFRPIIGKVMTPAAVPKEYSNIYPPSRIIPNPVAVLRADYSNANAYVDVSFNPWFTRQFGVIDDQGCWTLWIIEGRKSRRSGLEIRSVNTGKLYDNILDAKLNSWHRIMWVANVDTIIVCGRRHVAVFDVKSKSTLLTDLAPAILGSRSDQILDVKRSVTNPNHMFILTTSRVFWIGVKPLTEENEPSSSHGAHIYLSCRHYRDTSSESLKIVVSGDDEVSVLLFSETDLLINYYRFFMTSGATMRAACFQGSVKMSEASGQTPGKLKRLHKLHIEPAQLKIISSAVQSSQGLDYIKRGIKFYQVLCVWADHSLSSSLCGIGTFVDAKSVARKKLKLLPPTITISRAKQLKSSSSILRESFVVSDGSNDAEEDHDDEHSVPHNSTRSEAINDNQKLDDPSLRIDLNHVFRLAFRSGLSNAYDTELPPRMQNITEILNQIRSKIQKGVNEGHFPMATLLELSGSSEFSDDLGQASDILRDFFQSRFEDLNTEPASELVLSDLTSTPVSRHLASKNPVYVWPDLLEIYDLIIENWVGSLPITVSNKARGAKFKIIRRMAVELCLSSVAVSLRGSLLLPASEDRDSRSERPLGVQKITGNDVEPDSSKYLQLPLRTVNHNGASSTGGLESPPSAQTYSYGSLASAPKTVEDPAIMRLRSYAVSIKSKPDLPVESSTLLSHWPVSPQADPAQYIWKPGGKAFSTTEEEVLDESDSRSESQSRARQKFESSSSRSPGRSPGRSPSISAKSISQSSRPFGSQREETLNIFSSQTVDDLPMTQPDRGTFGSRSAQQSSKKKKRVSSGFR